MLEESLDSMLAPDSLEVAAEDVVPVPDSKHVSVHTTDHTRPAKTIQRDPLPWKIQEAITRTQKKEALNPQSAMQKYDRRSHEKKEAVQTPPTPTVLIKHVVYDSDTVYKV
jgi:hypothetical protein